MSRFLHSRFLALDAYTPGEQPKDTVYTKLNTNESPYPPGPRTVEAVQDAQRARSLRLYCDPDATALKDALAERYDTSRSNVFVSNGSDDILNFAFMAFGEQGVKYPAISYGFYPVFSQLHGLAEHRIPLKEDFSIDPAEYAGNDALVVIANPNAPTGIPLGLEQIREILEANPDQVVVIDEAYIDFGGGSCVPLTKQYENLLVVQTFSKSRSLAGARLGYAIAAASLIADLETIKYSTNPYNVNTVSAAAGCAALSEESYYQENCRKIQETRERAAARLSELGFRVIPSVSNFLFVSTDRIGGKELYEKLKDRHILIRHFDNPAISEYNRITIGTDEEMEILFAGIEEILGKEWV